MRRLTVEVEVEGGTPEQQADKLRELAFVVEHYGPSCSGGPIALKDNPGYWRLTIAEMADYDHKLLADAWYSGTGSASRSVNALARAADIDIERLRHILLGEKQATVKELNAICEELAVSVESVKDAEN